LVKEALERYPGSSLFAVMGSHCARKQCNVQLGITYMERALQACASFPKPPLIFKFELANCYLMQMDWKKAVENFIPLIDEQKFQVRSLAGLQMSGALIMLGETNKAIDLLNRVIKMTPLKKTMIDSMVERQARRYIANGGFFLSLELLYIRRDLAKMTPAMSKVLALLEEIAKKNPRCLERTSSESPDTSPSQNTQRKFSLGGLSSTFKLTKLENGLSNTFNKLDSVFGVKKREPLDPTVDDRAAYLLLKGSILKGLNNYTEAIPCFRELLSLEHQIREKFYVPYALYELGECIYNQKNLPEAKQLFTKCLKCNNFDWEEPLKVRLRVTLDILKKGQMPEQDKNTPSLDSLIGGAEKRDTKDEEDEEEDTVDAEQVKAELKEEED